MKKEIFLAIILGAVVALIISVVVYRSQNRDLGSSQDITSTVVTPNVDTPAGPDKILTIATPEDSMVYQEKDITITGRSLPGALVAVFVNDKQELVNADESGNFSLPTILESGSNVISVHSLDEQGNQHTDRIVVIYSNKSLEETLVSESELQEEVEKNEP